MQIARISVNCRLQMLVLPWWIMQFYYLAVVVTWRICGVIVSITQCILWHLQELFADGNRCYTIVYCSESDPDVLGFFTDRAQCSNRIWDPGGLVSKVQYSCQRFAGVHFLSLPAHYSKVKHNNGFRSHWWLVDSGAGKSMSYDKADFIQLKPWAGGSVKVGDGNIIEVTHRGVIQLYVRAPSPSPKSSNWGCQTYFEEQGAGDRTGTSGDGENGAANSPYQQNGDDYQARRSTLSSE